MPHLPIDLHDYEKAQHLIGRLTLERDSLRQATEAALKAVVSAQAAQQRAEARLAELEACSDSPHAEIHALRLQLREYQAENQKLKARLAPAPPNAPAHPAPPPKPSRQTTLIDPFASLGPERRPTGIETWKPSASGNTVRL